MKKLLFLSIFFSATTAFAAPTPSQSVCVSASGAISVKAKCKGGETKLSLSAIAGLVPQPANGSQGAQGNPGVQGAQGPQGNAGAQGPQGVQGAAGTPGFVNLKSCHSVSQQNTEISGANDVTSISVECSSNEFLLNHYGIVTDPTTTFISTIPLYFPGEGFASGVQYYFARIEPQNMDTVTSTAIAVCCSR